jgi:hypothetical protein
MEPDTSEPRKLWAIMLLVVMAVNLALLLVDRKIKNDIVKEAKALREEVTRERRREASPAAETHRSSGSAEHDGLVPVVDDPAAPASAVADADAGGGARVDGLGSPPHRGGVDGG